MKNILQVDKEKYFDGKEAGHSCRPYPRICKWLPRARMEPGELQGERCRQRTQKDSPPAEPLQGNHPWKAPNGECGDRYALGKVSLEAMARVGVMGKPGKTHRDTPRQAWHEVKRERARAAGSEEKGHAKEMSWKVS